MVNTGSSASILSYELFAAIGKKANIPESALYPPKVPTLRGYSHQPIATGSMVDLEFTFNGRKVLALVYIRAKRQRESEPCLQETNVINALWLMQPADGVLPAMQATCTATVHLIQAQRVPSGKGVYLEAKVEAASSTPVI